jgi:prevent-host-death family protein
MGERSFDQDIARLRMAFEFTRDQGASSSANTTRRRAAASGRGRLTGRGGARSGDGCGRRKWLQFWTEVSMRFASVADVKNDLSAFLARAQKKNESIVITRHGKPYALIQPITEQDLESLEWKGLAKSRLAKAWEGEDDSLYDYL